MSNHPPSPDLRDAAVALMLEEMATAGIDYLAHSPPDSGGLETTTELPLLEKLAAEIRACRACPLGDCRTNAVPGEGASKARLMFIGEAPGTNENASGRPFVGRGGQLLDKMIVNGMGLTREEVFIANVLKCQPPGNRDPLPAEKEACADFLARQIRAVKPELIIALGRHAACSLLGVDSSLHSLRGRIHKLPQHDSLMVATYHPAYLLRTPSAKADCWQDLQLAMTHLNIPRPKPR